MSEKVTPNFELFELTGLNCCGKEVQGNLLREKISGLELFSVSRALRLATEGVPGYERLQPMAEKYMPMMAAGDLIPDKEVVPLMINVISNMRDRGIRRVLLDGTPRTENQDDALRYNYPDAINHWIWPVIPDDLSLKRSDGRYRSDVEAGRKPRPDDNPEIARKRIAIFHEVIAPLIHRAQEEGNLVKVDGTPPIPEVHASIRAGLEKRGVPFLDV